MTLDPRMDCQGDQRLATPVMRRLGQVLRLRSEYARGSRIAKYSFPIDVQLHVR